MEWSTLICNVDLATLWSEAFEPFLVTIQLSMFIESSVKEVKIIKDCFAMFVAVGQSLRVLLLQVVFYFSLNDSMECCLFVD